MTRSRSPGSPFPAHDPERARVADRDRSLARVTRLTAVGGVGAIVVTGALTGFLAQPGHAKPGASSSSSGSSTSSGSASSGSASDSSSDDGGLQPSDQAPGDSDSGNSQPQVSTGGS
jgi:hypothetical protein